jgi:eukaryotic-like serine/threonine-protein kinase
MPQDTENWELLQTLFHLAEGTPKADRERVLAGHCPDPELRRRVITILHGADLDEVARAPETQPSAGRFGPYSLIRLIGAGGIGSVYLAERILGGTPHRVALKILSPHAAGPSFVERFHREQHILASLDHKNITRMLDAGISDSGQPYLVMEYINGVHLDQYGTAQRLDIRHRIELFLQICDAVAYAHRNLIVHLDLKPSNVLVNEEGTVKLLDFGTSKLIQPDSLLTTTVLATPAYASPEQLRNEPVTTACDIYSLGAILFDLLAGRRPTDKVSAAAMFERAMTEAEPDRLPDAVTARAAETRGVPEGRLRQLLAGDLATITAKCLRPRAKDRYPSVDAFAEDLRRYLDGRAVLARPQTAIYRLGKFVRRHRVGVTAGLVATTLLLGSLSYAVWRQQQALREAQRAERMQTFMHQLFRLANSNYTGKPAVTVPEFLQLGVKILPDYIRNPADLLQAKIALAESMFDNGDLSDASAIFQQTAVTARSMGDTDAEAESDAFAGHIAFSQGDVNKGRQLTGDALRLSRQPGVSAIVRVRAAIYYAWNRDNYYLSDEDLNLLRYAADEARRNDLPLHEKADAIHELGNNLLYRGHLVESQQLENEALALLKQDPSSICDQSEIYGELAEAKELNLDYDGALTLWQRSYSGYSECSGAAGREAISMLAYEARNLVYMGRAPEAVRLLEPSRRYWEKLPDPYGRWGVFAVSLANAYVAVGRYKEAEDLISTMMKRAEKLSASWSHGYGEYIWAASLAGQQKYEEALTHAENASKDWSAIPASMTLNPEDYRRLSDLHRILTDIRAHRGALPSPAGL